MAYPPPTTDDAEGIELLGEALRSAGYTADAVCAALGLENLFQRDPSDTPEYLHLLPPGERLTTLTELFLFGLQVDVGRVAQALAPLAPERAERIGLIQPVDGSACAVVEIVPVEDLFVASDQAKLYAHQPDHVLGVARPTRVLGSMTVRRQVASAVDIGTGSGFQALEAARHTRTVAAADINPRALRFGEFNAALNGFSNIEFRAGSLFEPVAGSAFDLAVCNPPYIISPETAFAFRDSGLPGDSFCEALVREMPEYLNDGGFGHALICWAHGEGEDWSAPLRRWVDGSGCDALLLRYRTWEPLEYAAGWNRPLRDDPLAYADAIDRWTAYYRELGIERMSWGGIVLRRRHGSNWVWTHEPSADRINPASDHLLRLFAAQDLLRGIGGRRDLLGRRLRLAADHRLEQTSRLDADAEAVGPAILRLEGGLRFQVELDDASVVLLSQLDGTRTLGDAVERVAPDAQDALVTSIVAAAGRLLELGFLAEVDGEE